MILKRLPLPGVTPETVVTMHGVGGKVLGAIEGEEQLVLEAPEVGQRAVRLQALEDCKAHLVEGTGPARIEPGASLILTGHLLHAQQGAGILVSLGWLEMALILQK